MRTLLRRPALTFDATTHDVADLVLVGLMTQGWQDLLAEVTRGLELQQCQPQVPSDQHAAAMRKFRYARRLIAAAELTAWLAARELTIADLDGVLRRICLRATDPDTGRPSATLPADLLRPVLRAEALCSGTLQRCAEQVLAWHAADLALQDPDIAGAAPTPPAPDPARVEQLLGFALADDASGLPELGEADLRRRAERLVTLEAAATYLRATAISDDEVEVRVAERRLEWTVVAGSELAFDTEGPARESRLRVNHDGDTLAAVAIDVRRVPVPRELALGTLPPTVAVELLAARPGEIVGPWREGDGWHVFERGPNPDDDGTGSALRDRARTELAAELTERYAAGHAAIVAAL